MPLPRCKTCLPTTGDTGYFSLYSNMRRQCLQWRGWWPQACSCWGFHRSVGQVLCVALARGMNCWWPHEDVTRPSGSLWPGAGHLLLCQSRPVELTSCCYYYKPGSGHARVLTSVILFFAFTCPALRGLLGSVLEGKNLIARRLSD